MSNPSSNIYSTQIEPKKGDIKLQKSLLKLGCEGDFDAIKTMFQQFIPEDEEIYDARYLGIQGFFGLGNRQFACVTERRIAHISVGYFGELNYEDGYLEHINSGFVYKPSKLVLYIYIGAVIAAITYTLSSIIAGIIFAIAAITYTLISAAITYTLSSIAGIIFALVLALIILPFSAKIYYLNFKCGLVLPIREGKFVLAPYRDNVYWYRNHLLYIFTDHKLLTRANALYREFIIRREERLNTVEKYPVVLYM